jgi:hypothetical protein
MLQPKKDILELIHARIDEQQRRVVGRHERGRVHTVMTLLLKELQEEFTNLVAGTKLHTYKSTIVPDSASKSLPASSLFTVFLRRIWQQ